MNQEPVDSLFLCQPLCWLYLLFLPNFVSIVSFSVAQLKTLISTSPICIPRKTRKRCECLKDGGKLEIRSNIVSLAIGSQQHHQGFQFQMDHPNWDTIPSVVSKPSAKWKKLWQGLWNKPTTVLPKSSSFGTLSKLFRHLSTNWQRVLSLSERCRSI